MEEGREMPANPERWCWVVLVASFTAFVTLGVSIGSMQYYYDEMLERFGESAAVSAGPGGRFSYNRKIRLRIIRKKANYGRYTKLGKCLSRKFRIFSVLRHSPYHTEKISSVLTALLPAKLPLTL